MIATRRAVGLLGLLGSLLVIICGVQVTNVHADEEEQARITLTSISPTVLGPSGELVISGTVTNETADELSRVEVRLWRDATPLRTSSAIEAAATSTGQTGAVMESASAQQSIKDGAPLAPGETAEFTVRAVFGPEATEQSWLSEPNAAYQLGVEAYGYPPFGGYQLLGRATSFMPYPGSTKTTTATIVVLNRRPSLLPLAAAVGEPAVFVDDSLAGELRGRLDALLRLGEQDGVLTVIDPALYDEVLALSRGYRVQQPDATQTQGSPATVALAADWLRRIDGLAGQRRAARSVYGSVDVLGATTAQRPDIIAAAGAALPTTHPLAQLPLVVVPADYEVDDASPAAVAAANPWLVLAANLGGAAALQADGGVRLLAVSPDLTQATHSLPQLRGRLLSEQLVGALEGRVRVSAVATEQQAIVELEAEGWRTREPVAVLVDAQPVPGGLLLATLPQVQVAPEVIGATDRAVGLLEAWAELVDAEVAGSQQRDHIVATGWSSTFGRDAGAQVDWLRRATAPADSVLSSDEVQLRISDWVTTSADDNLLPVTVTNNSLRPVQVQVRFTSDNPLRISVDDSELFTVQPGESTTVRVRPRAQGNGKVAITAQLTTSGGHPIGRPTSFVITGTEAGRVGWLIIVASGAVLLVATVLRVRQVRQVRQGKLGG